ncbi:MAG: hypothetical protein ACRBCK_06910 [Alphaproteobacteria bacterium]
MRINGKLFTAEFKEWLHMPEDGHSNVIGIGDEKLCAHFQLSSWSEQGKTQLKDIYHTVEQLLDIEECLTCDKEHVNFPGELEQVLKALEAYKGKVNIRPLQHSQFESDSGFYPREIS